MSQLIHLMKFDASLQQQNDNRFQGNTSIIPSGLLIANEPHPKRCLLLTKYHEYVFFNETHFRDFDNSFFKKTNCFKWLIEFCSCLIERPFVCVTQHKAQDFPHELTTSSNSSLKLEFDRILCDVPCSGDGTLRSFIPLTFHFKTFLIVVRFCDNFFSSLNFDFQLSIENSQRVRGSIGLLKELFECITDKLKFVQKEFHFSKSVMFSQNILWMYWKVKWNLRFVLIWCQSGRRSISLFNVFLESHWKWSCRCNNSQKIWTSSYTRWLQWNITKYFKIKTKNKIN